VVSQGKKEMSVTVPDVVQSIYGRHWPDGQKHQQLPHYHSHEEVVVVSFKLHAFSISCQCLVHPSTHEITEAGSTQLHSSDCHQLCAKPQQTTRDWTTTDAAKTNECCAPRCPMMLFASQLDTIRPASVRIAAESARKTRSAVMENVASTCMTAATWFFTHNECILFFVGYHTFGKTVLVIYGADTCTKTIVLKQYYDLYFTSHQI